VNGAAAFHVARAEASVNIPAFRTELAGTSTDTPVLTAALSESALVLNAVDSAFNAADSA